MNNTTEVFDNVEVLISRYQNDQLLFCLVVTFITIGIFLLCGAWCIYAIRKMQEESSVYHFENEFKPDDDSVPINSKRKPAGFCDIDIENKERRKRNRNNYFKSIGKSFIIWKE
ncbi:uncharacterized protein CELE_C45B11.5 [Caenorhabditis elegans]|uniref:Uncharacterized protein n=1 Tax=Caenorhabditis elegans TaxID=6239 RepID=Q7YX55_CAEEL|nr:Uncharacterized protein CELE_C45B11.5 [Caenorhabditis elegans]CAE17749.1 Uncharacterized protein CELE_C45B11.5 [Caenorhabditis elegans]|eukprot:NP_001023709.1 Uncharacterized protein CELE_C45B11.5 [Caenorhabditis elegans]